MNVRGYNYQETSITVELHTWHGNIDTSQFADSVRKGRFNTKVKLVFIASLTNSMLMLQFIMKGCKTNWHK
jgi:hypothetical protein